MGRLTDEVCADGIGAGSWASPVPALVLGGLSVQCAGKAPDERWTYADLFDDDLDAVAVTLHGRYGPEPGHFRRPAPQE